MTSGKMIESGIGGFILQKLGKGGGRVQMGNFSLIQFSKPVSDKASAPKNNAGRADCAGIIFWTNCIVSEKG